MGLIARHPRLSLALVLFALALPALILTRLGRGQRFLRWYTNGAIGLVCAMALVRAGIYLIHLRPAIEGVDFYNYLCVARDMHHGATDLSDWRYAYFPGV